MNVNEKLVVEFLTILCEGRIWTSLGQKSSMTRVHNAIPALWGLALHVDDSRGNDDVLLGMMDEEEFEKMAYADGDSPEYHKYAAMLDRVTEAQIAVNVATGLATAMVGYNWFLPSEEKEDLWKRVYCRYDKYVRDGHLLSKKQLDAFAFDLSR